MKSDLEKAQEYSVKYECSKHGHHAITEFRCLDCRVPMIRCEYCDEEVLLTAIEGQEDNRFGGHRIPEGWFKGSIKVKDRLVQMPTLCPKHVELVQKMLVRP